MVYRNLINRGAAELIKFHKHRGAAELFMRGKPRSEMCNLITPRKSMELIIWVKQAQNIQKHTGIYIEIAGKMCRARAFNNC